MSRVVIYNNYCVKKNKYFAFVLIFLLPILCFSMSIGPYYEVNLSYNNISSDYAIELNNRVIDELIYILEEIERRDNNDEVVFHTVVVDISRVMNSIELQVQISSEEIPYKYAFKVKGEFKYPREIVNEFILEVEKIFECDLANRDRFRSDSENKITYNSFNLNLDFIKYNPGLISYYPGLKYDLKNTNYLSQNLIECFERTDRDRKIIRYTFWASTLVSIASLTTGIALSQGENDYLDKYGFAIGSVWGISSLISLFAGLSEFIPPKKLIEKLNNELYVQ